MLQKLRILHQILCTNVVGGLRDRNNPRKAICCLGNPFKNQYKKNKEALSIYLYCSHENVPDLQAIIGRARHKLRLQSVVQDVHNFLHFIQYVGISCTRGTVIVLSTKDTIHFNSSITSFHTRNAKFLFLGPKKVNINLSLYKS